jgi:asparagine synthase (glutamine-hydrolysing)
MSHQYLSRIENLLRPEGNVLLNMTYDEAAARVLSGDPKQVDKIDGQFAIMVSEGKTVRMARSIGRPLRYFLAKLIDGPCLLVAERMDEIVARLKEMGIEDQFHPSYTRMVPAHHVVQIQLVGCPDPNPKYDRFFTPVRNNLPPDIDTIGQLYIARLAQECDLWLDTLSPEEPIGVLFSGGIDSGAVLVTIYDRLLKRGESPDRLKAFTLRVDQCKGDASQAQQFVRHCNIEEILEIIDCDSGSLDWKETIRILEDYKPLDVQSGTMAIALCREIRNRYPDWKNLVDGDGGDENLKDYPIEENPELTIRSVLNNLMLYQEGWGVHAIKHSLTYSGGQSRGHIRTSAPAAFFGFRGFSPFSLPRVIEIAESIPFIKLTQWDHQKLYELKGEVVRAGIRAVCGIDMPAFEKKRFQHGAMSPDRFETLFPKEEATYRFEFANLYPATRR